MADATGAADCNINVENDAANTDAAIDVSGVETISHVVSADTNDATVDMTLAEINVSGGAAGALLALDTLASTTTTVDLSSYSGEVSFSGTNAASSMTGPPSSAADDNFTLSGKNDTVTGATGAVDVDVDGGAGTDTMI